MDEDLQKRNTDCIYFLASPLTCKKGIECEYRHSEIARLNPRDCWFWMSGNCLNPTCGFRHPPLENNAEVPSETAGVPPANKTTAVPCYFFFNGFCNKGDKCSFSHGPDGNTSAVKPMKPASAGTGAQDNGIRSTATMANFRNPESSSKAEMVPKLQFQEDGHQQPCKTITEQSPISPADVTQPEEASVHMSDSLPKEGGFAHSGIFTCPDQSSEEQVDDHVEDHLESSPGFDVLVNDKYENVGYEDDQEFIVDIEREKIDLRNGYLGYDYEHEDEYKPSEPLYESNINVSFDCEDDVHVIDSLLSQKRKDRSIHERVVDLRDHLSKRRTSDGRSFEPSRRHDSSFRHGIRSPERHHRRGIGQRLHGRLSSEVRVNSTETLRNNNYRQPYKSRKNHLSFDIRKQVPREKGAVEASTLFSGPKSLAQIKEEKNSGYVEKDSSRMVSADFEGPKSLSEILKDKRGMGSVYANGESN